MDRLEALVDDLRAEHDDLDSIVGAFAVTDFDKPTPAEGWAVRDQISHLAFFDEAATSAIVDPDSFRIVAEAARDREGDPMEVHLERGRSMNPAELLTWWRQARGTLLQSTARLDARARVPWFGPDMSAMSFVSARLMETWAHGQDVADAGSVERKPTTRLKHIAHIGVRARPFSYMVRGMDVPAAEVNVELAAPDGGLWKWDEEVEASGDGRPLNFVRGSALDFCLVVTQRRNIADTALEVHGEDAGTWMQIAQAFAGPPGQGRPPRR